MGVKGGIDVMSACISEHLFALCLSVRVVAKYQSPRLKYQVKKFVLGFFVLHHDQLETG